MSKDNYNTDHLGGLEEDYEHLIQGLLRLGFNQDSGKWYLPISDTTSVVYCFDEIYLLDHVTDYTIPLSIVALDDLSEFLSYIIVDI